MDDCAQIILAGILAVVGSGSSICGPLCGLFISSFICGELSGSAAKQGAMMSFGFSISDIAYCTHLVFGLETILEKAPGIFGIFAKELLQSGISSMS